jgi:hypothetical protein
MMPVTKQHKQAWRMCRLSLRLDAIAASRRWPAHAAFGAALAMKVSSRIGRLLQEPECAWVSEARPIIAMSSPSATHHFSGLSEKTSCARDWCGLDGVLE